MNRKVILVILVLAVVAAAACASSDERGGSAQRPAKQTEKAASPSSETASHAPQQMGGHEHGAQSDMPAFLTTAADLKTLRPTLAQLPCYCHCDRGFGHKSLQSCFVDEHAAHCAVCIDEALVAYQLEKKEGLKPEQIRERVIEQFSN